MFMYHIVADSGCDIFSIDGASFSTVPLTISTENEHFVDDKPIMTNFYLYGFDGNTSTAFYKEDDYNSSETTLTKYSAGIERYDILSENYASSNSMEGMWNLLKMVRYTQEYDVNTDPFWCSEFFDTAKIPTFDEHPMEYWTKDRILAEEIPQEEIAAYEEYAATGKYDPEAGLWFTAHNSTYNIADKSLWVTIREKYEKHYEFKL